MVKTLGGIILQLIIIAALGVAAYAGKAWIDAGRDARALRLQADYLIATGRSGADLGEGRLNRLLMVQDPAFYSHSGVDLSTAGAGLTTVTQSLSKRVAFTEFRGGIPKIRQTVYAMRLEKLLTKEQIIALFLDTVPMGKGPDGWMVGFFSASDAIFSEPPDKISMTRFLTLVAVMIAPRQYDLLGNDVALGERVRRITLLVKGHCKPADQRDVWLTGCAH